MKLSVIGTGYVGLVSAACFAELGYTVIGADIDEAKIKMLKDGQIPIYEPGLQEIVEKNMARGRLRFTTDLKEAIEFADIVFGAVGTPPDLDHRADLTAVKAIAKAFGSYINGYKIFVNKSTVPVGTGEICHGIIEAEITKRGVSHEFDVVSNPEFLREGAAVKDTLNPERIIIGCDGLRAKSYMEKVYRPITRIGHPILFSDIRTAELIKYAANSFLATKISFINEIANFCEKTGADVMQVAKGIGMDQRIGSRFLHAGIGYGGSCFPKDVQALIQKGKEFGFDFKLLQAAEDVNYFQKERLFEKLRQYIPSLEGKTIAVWGLAFKPRTDDMRDAPSVRIIKRIQAEGAKVQAYDPVATQNAKKLLAGVNLKYATSAMEAVQGADALLVLTEWDEFRTTDFREIKKQMKGDYIFDGRNIFEPEEVRSAGLFYEGIGRGYSAQPTTNVKPKLKMKKINRSKAKV
jgi:UDPglucose 6-dehydrogenase